MDTEYPIERLIKEKLLQDQNIVFALIFGSYATGRQHKNSDLDIALFFKNPPKGLEILDLINELSKCCKKEIDLVVLNSASPFLKHQIMKSAILLLIRDQLVYRSFREQTITDYDDYKFLSGMNKYD